MESPEAGRAVALEFPVSETAPFSRVPSRIRKRLLAECKTPSTVEEIEAKLRHADLRRQQFYKNVASKARPKPRSPSRSSSPEEEPGQRLEAKLQAAEQKRLSILAKSQMRLARLDKLRQAAKNGVEMRFEREREKLGTRVESRVQQAEANRMLILKAYSQRRATLKERSYQSLLRRMARESKYKERVRAAIHQKRMAAEKKRQGLLDAEKKRAHARVLQVRRVAKSVSHQREVERSRMRDQLEDKLQRAKRQRAEYLRQRGRTRNSVQGNWNKMHMQADMLSIKLARCWKQFVKLRRTTLELAKAFDALKVNVDTVKSMPFEQLALLIESSTTIQTVKALLDRIENRLKVSKAIGAIDNTYNLENVDHLLKRVATPRKRVTPRASKMSKNAKRAREAVKSSATLSRYPVRIVLCAYMILGHPDAVLSSQGEHEVALARSAEAFIREFQLLMKIILGGPVDSSNRDQAALPKCLTFRSQLNAFDKAWCSYLSCFVVWKVNDAQSLEEDLVRAACHLELSMIQKCKLTPEGQHSALTHDMKAIQRQVAEDQRLLREKVQHLSGEAGIQRMEVALSEMRARYFEAVENGSTVGSAIAHIPSLSSPSSASTTPIPSTGSKNNLPEKPNNVVRKLFKEDDELSSKNSSFSVSSSSVSNDQLVLPADRQQIIENELIVNEFLHKQHHGFLDSIGGENLDGVKLKVRETMEKAFWDDILESARKDEPDYNRVIQLMKEVRDEICEISPLSWKQEIAEAIDLEIFSQVLRSGHLDISYLGRILSFALTTLQKLSSPARDDEMKAAHQKLLIELADICQAKESSHSPAVAMIRGLRFVLEQIQALKQEISKARIQLMEPLLKGPAGLDYLQKAFANHHGSPSDACVSLPLTVQWLSFVSGCKDSEWQEHTDSLRAFAVNQSSSQSPVTLRTGGSLHSRNGSEIISTAHASALGKTGQVQPGSNGEVVDLLIRIGLVKLVTGVSGLTSEVLPETFRLNLSRLRNVQAEIQKIIVVCTSVLICRQTLLSEPVAVPAAADTVISKCTDQLLKILDCVEDVGLEGIVEVMAECLGDGEMDADGEKLQARKMVMARTLAKSLQAGNAVFEKVSEAVYKAVRGVVLGGSGPQGRRLAEGTLRQVGASLLTPRVVAAAEVLVVAATVSISIHGPWYKNLVDGKP